MGAIIALVLTDYGGHVEAKKNKLTSDFVDQFDGSAAATSVCCSFAR